MLDFSSTNSKYTKEQMEEYKNIVSFYKNLGSIFKMVYDHAYECSKDKDYYKSYHEIIKRVADLCDKLSSASQPLLVSIIYEYLLWGGYLSKDHRYAYDTSNRVNNFACAGADIMRGHGVCLNNADMLTKIYQELGYEAYSIGVSVNKSVKKLKIWNPDIERCIDHNSRFFNFISLSGLIKKIGNHEITIVKNEVLELYDPTKMSVLKPTDVLKASYIGTNCNLDLKIWSMITSSGLLEDENHTEVTDVTNLLFAQGVTNINALPPLDEYKDTCTRILSCLKRIEPLLNDLYEKNKKDIDIVTRSLTNEIRHF